MIENMPMDTSPKQTPESGRWPPSSWGDWPESGVPPTQPREEDRHAANSVRQARNLRLAFYALALGWITGWLIKACTP